MGARDYVPPPPTQPKTEEGWGSKIAGAVFAVCLCVLMIAGTIRALMWLF